MPALFNLLEVLEGVGKRGEERITCAQGVNICLSVEK